MSDAGAASPGWKRGLAYGYDSDSDMTALSKGIGWWYNWAASPDGTLSKGFTAGVEFVPMIWGGTFDTTTLAKQVPAGAKYLLTFNEPNFGSQSNLTPDQAAALWPQIQSFASARGMKIVSPGRQLLRFALQRHRPVRLAHEVLRRVHGLPGRLRRDALVRVHQVRAHQHGREVRADVRQAALGHGVLVPRHEERRHRRFELSYMKDAVAALEADPMVFRYAWFTGRSSGSPPISVLGTDGGVLTPLGQQYVTLPR